MADENKNIKSKIAEREEEILKFWQENKIFEKSLKKPSPKGEFVFYDGPPFATGLPHYGSLLSSTGKDLIPRYKTMRGFRIRRRWGWDCHGLPIESIVEKKLGLKHKKDIEILGIEKFNEECRTQVLTYAHDWKKYIDRLGRWVDFDNSYKTMDASYTESVWWALSQIHKKGMLYEGRKVLLYCPRCETPLSRAEIAMDNSYQDVTEEAVTIEFKIKNHKKFDLPENTFLLAWTTTPWTLPANVALAVGLEIDYVVIEKKDMGVGKLVRFVLAKSRLEAIFGNDKYKIIKEVKGKDLVGLEYEPLYDLPAVRATGKKAWYVAPADFVTTEDGTGIVHTAVIYGEDDYRLGLKIDLPMVPLLLPNGNFNNDAPEPIRGIYIKTAEDSIKEDLENRGLLFDKAPNTHSYPHCYRCGTPLIYNALSSWFIDIQKIKKEMLKKNENINWVPEHLKHGRFQDIVENAPDWNISRNRFWASPLPIWKNEKTGKIIVIGSIDELKKYTKKSGNKYFVIRHGEAENNVKQILSAKEENPHHLTEKGISDIRKAAEELKKEKIDTIISSPFLRAKETAEIMAEIISLDKKVIQYDKRIGEHNYGDFDLEPVAKYHNYYSSFKEAFIRPLPNGESYDDTKARVGEFIYDLEKNFSNKNILIITHESPSWLMFAAAQGLDREGCMKLSAMGEDFLKNSELRKLDFVPLSHNKNYELDLHRPYIDEIELIDKDSSALKRITEVIDCWVESGSMPFAEYNYPYSNKEEFEKRTPGDFVVEYIPQTRTWFYYMHALSVALFEHEPFKNVLTTGTILAADGSKMSKSKGNFTDPLVLMSRFGADALRYYMMTSVVMQAEDLNFKDEDVKEVYQRMINILLNVVMFYKTYKTDFSEVKKTDNILDQWIISRLGELYAAITENLEKYDTIKAGRPIRGFIDDLSTWYLRRSRDRFKSEDVEERKKVSQTCRFVLLELSKIIAPFTPFLAEHIYQAVKKEEDPESVHLCDWPARHALAGEAGGPETDTIEQEILNNMGEARRIVSLALEKRMSAGIKVRQPLQKIQISKSKFQNLGEEYLNLIKDEVNVKEIVFQKDLEEEVELDTEITEELQKEGNVREIIRAVQELRKQKNLVPTDAVGLLVEADDASREFLNSVSEEIKRRTNVSEIVFAENDGQELKIGNYKLKFKIK